MASLFDAINAAAAALSNAPRAPKGERGEVKSEKSPIRVQPKVQPGAQAKVQPKVRVQPKSAISGSEKGTVKSEKSSTEPVCPKVSPSGTKAPTEAPKPSPKTDAAKRKGGASYVIPAEFKQAIETYLKGRADMREKLSAKGKSIDGCCDYIFDVMRKRAEKSRGGKSAVGLYAPPEEIFGLAVHYYDESEESLKAELKS